MSETLSTFKYGNKISLFFGDSVVINLNDDVARQRLIDLLETKRSGSIKWVDMRDNTTMKPSPITITVKKYVQVGKTILRTLVEPHSPEIAWTGGEVELTDTQVLELIEKLAKGG